MSNLTKDRRSLFEAWVLDVRASVYLGRDGDGYVDRDVDWLWDAFNAGWEARS